MVATSRRSGPTERDIYRHRDTINPSFFRQKLIVQPEPTDAIKVCRRFNNAALTFIVDGADRPLIFQESLLFQDNAGRVDLTFLRTNPREEDESWYEIDFHLWLGEASHAFPTHRLVLVVDGILVRPWSEWHKFRAGPYKEGKVIQLFLAYDEQIPALLRWEQEACDKIEQIDSSLGKYRLKLTQSAVNVCIVANPPEDSDACRVVADAVGGAATIILPKWFRSGYFHITPLNKTNPFLEIDIMRDQKRIPLTPKKLLRAGFKPGSILRVSLEGSWCSFN